MYDELVKRLHQRIALTHAGSPLQDDLQEAADAIEELIAALTASNTVIANSKPHWISVEERLPDTGVDVLVKFPHNMAVASIDIGEWVVNSGDGWCTDINLAGGEKNPTHWMPLPEPPKEE